MNALDNINNQIKEMENKLNSLSESYAKEELMIEESYKDEISNYKKEKDELKIESENINKMLSSISIKYNLISAVKILIVIFIWVLFESSRPYIVILLIFIYRIKSSYEVDDLKNRTQQKFLNLYKQKLEERAKIRRKEIREYYRNEQIKIDSQLESLYRRREYIENKSIENPTAP